MGASAFVAQTFFDFWLFCTSRPPPTTTFTDWIFEIFSILHLRFLVSTYRRRTQGAVFPPDFDFVVYGSGSTAVLEILRRSCFLQLLSLRFCDLGFTVETCLGVPGFASACRGDLLGRCVWVTSFGGVSHYVLVSHGPVLGVSV